MGVGSAIETSATRNFQSSTLPPPRRRGTGLRLKDDGGRVNEARCRWSSAPAEKNYCARTYTPYTPRDGEERDSDKRTMGLVLTIDGSIISPAEKILPLALSTPPATARN